jgi:hypothetical protein
MVFLKTLGPIALRSHLSVALPFRRDTIDFIVLFFYKYVATHLLVISYEKKDVL